MSSPRKLRGWFAGCPSARGDEISEAKKKHKNEKHSLDGDASGDAPSAPDETDAGPPKKMKRKEYEREMRILQGELVTMQEWVKNTGARVCLVFEGVDSAGQGRHDPADHRGGRVFKHIALPAPDARVRSQMYVQRYISQFPSAGEVVIFDRSWYNRAGVEPVMGYCTPEETKRFLEVVPQVEKAMVDDGIILIKYFLNVSREEQTRRLENRIDDPRDHLEAVGPPTSSPTAAGTTTCGLSDAMFAATSTEWAPWHIVDNDDKKRGRLNIISHLLSQIPYDAARGSGREDAQAAERTAGTSEPASSRPNIPTPF